MFGKFLVILDPKAFACSFTCAVQDVERVTDVLESLGGVNMTLALLKESKVGSAVAKLKKHADERVSNSAKALVRKWKKVAEASGVQGTAKPEKPASPKGTMTAVTVVSQCGVSRCVSCLELAAEHNFLLQLSSIPSTNEPGVLIGLLLLFIIPRPM